MQSRDTNRAAPAGRLSSRSRARCMSLASVGSATAFRCTLLSGPEQLLLFDAAERPQIMGFQRRDVPRIVGLPGDARIKSTRERTSGNPAAKDHPSRRRLPEALCK